MYFASSYSMPMDKDYHIAALPEYKEEEVLEKPIVPLRQLGATVPEKSPNGANIIQSTEAAIRAGQPNIQLVFMTQTGAPVGGRPKAYGKEVREAIRSMAKINEVTIEGAEMPSGAVNMAGFDAQNFQFSEEKRQHDLDEVRDYIKFVADVGGGGVDHWSAEFPRTVFDAKWNRKDPKGNMTFQMYEGESEKGVKYLVDKRRGKVIQDIRMDQKIFFPEWQIADNDYTYTDDNGSTVRVKKGDYVDYEKRKVAFENRVPIYDEKERKFKVKQYGWKDFEEEAKRMNQELKPETPITPEEAFFRATTMAQEAIARGYELHYTEEIDKMNKAIEKLKKAKDFYNKAEKEAKTEEEKMIFMRQADDIAAHVAPGILPPTFKMTSELIDESIGKLRRQIEQSHTMASGQAVTAAEHKTIRENLVTLDDYAKKKLFDSYAQMGVYAMQETQMNKNADRPVWVGPENGWPTYFGGHPQEFKEIILESRKKMAEMLSKPVVDGKPNPLYAGMDEKTAMKKASDHIKGCFDTSHMGMWLNNFRRVPGESEDKRVEEFKKWYLQEVEDLAKNNLIGSVQAVDSASGAHGHLPPGQGFLGDTLMQSVAILKKNGFDGAVISEGHEEEQFYPQRIFTEAMKAFGSPISTGYGGGSPMPNRWASVSNSYFGRTYTPMFIVGAYSPSNDFKLWSEVPLE